MALIMGEGKNDKLLGSVPIWIWIKHLFVNFVNVARGDIFRYTEIIIILIILKQMFDICGGHRHQPTYLYPLSPFTCTLLLFTSPSPFIITHPESWYSFTVPRRVEGWVNIGTRGVRNLNLPKVFTQQPPGLESNPASTKRQSDALPVAPPRHLIITSCNAAFTPDTCSPVQVVSTCIPCHRLHVSCIGDKIDVTATCIHLYPRVEHCSELVSG